MTTATAAMMKQDQDARDDNRLNQIFSHFLEAYKPKDPRDALDFEMSLHHLVRAVYAEAAKPYEKILMGAVALQPLGGFIVKD